MDWDLGRIIAMNLKQLRTERSLTLGQLAKESGVSKAILSDMEKGESNPTINTIIKVSKGLNVPYSRLMEGVEPESTLVRQPETVMQANETTTTVSSATSPPLPNATSSCSGWSWTPTPPTSPSPIPPNPRNTCTCWKGS